MSAHTPGPWKRVSEMPWIVRSEDCTTVVDCRSSDTDLSVDIANAGLIAESPSMLALLQLLVSLSDLVGAEDIVSKTSSLVADARKTIAKATGESALSATIERPAAMTDEHLEYLDDLRASGATNMFGARPFLMEDFHELSPADALAILSFWMQDDRHIK